MASLSPIASAARPRAQVGRASTIGLTVPSSTWAKCTRSPSPAGRVVHFGKLPLLTKDEDGHPGQTLPRPAQTTNLKAFSSQTGEYHDGLCSCLRHQDYRRPQVDDRVRCH